MEEDSSVGYHPFQSYLIHQLGILTSYELMTTIAKLQYIDSKKL